MTPESFKFKSRFTNKANNAGIENVEITVPLKYFINYWRNFKMALINCEINFLLAWLANCVPSTQFRVHKYRVPTFAIADTKLYFTVVTLST